MWPGYEMSVFRVGLSRPLSGLTEQVAARSTTSNDTSFEGRPHSDVGCDPQFRSTLFFTIAARCGNVAVAESVAPLVYSFGSDCPWMRGRVRHVYVLLACTLPRMQGSSDFYARQVGR